MLSYFLQAGLPAAIAGETDPVLIWLQRLSVGSALAGILLLVVLLIIQRRLSENLIKIFSLAGIVILPLVSLAMGNLVGLQQAKKVEFCGSCHLTMGTFVADLRNPDSTSLAAKHFRNRWIPEAQCYTCHASYGLFGDVQAKMAGLGDVYKYYTHTYKYPIALHEPYQNAECLKCHEHTPKFVNSETHGQGMDAIRSGEIKCIECHGPAHILEETHESRLRR